MGPTERRFPNKEIESGAHLTIGGLEFVVRDQGPGESYADSYWELLGPVHVAFVGDNVLYHDHAYTNDGHTRDWLAHLAQMRRALGGVSMLYPGHGSSGDL